MFHLGLGRVDLVVNSLVRRMSGKDICIWQEKSGFPVSLVGFRELAFKPVVDFGSYDCWIH